MEEQFVKLKSYLIGLYDRNPFVQLLKMKIISIDAGKAELAMPIQYEIHTNLYQMAHGGATASLIDTAMGVACATTGKRVVTLDLHVHYIKGVPEQPEIRASATVIHNGSRTLVVEAKLLDGQNNLLAQASGTFFVIGRFEGE